MTVASQLPIKFWEELWSKTDFLFVLRKLVEFAIRKVSQMAHNLKKCDLRSRKLYLSNLQSISIKYQKNRITRIFKNKLDDNKYEIVLFKLLK